MPQFNTPQHKLIDYKEAKEIFWDRLYRKHGITIYSREAVAANSRRWANIEHVFPMSWVCNAIGCGDRDRCRRYSDLFNQIEADIHNMYPSRRDLNYERGSFGFDMVKGESRKYGDHDFEIDVQRRKVEPTLESRGNIARAMLYMADAYDLKIFKRQLIVLKGWHHDDPPSDRERLRNDLIEKIQGNRNHFIDHPEDIERPRN